MNEEALFNSGGNVCPLNAKVRVFLEIFALCLSAGCFLMKELKSRGVTKSKLRCFLTLRMLLTHFKRLVSFIHGFLMFSRGIERNNVIKWIIIVYLVFLKKVLQIRLKLRALCKFCLKNFVIYIALCYLFLNSYRCTTILGK